MKLRQLGPNQTEVWFADDTLVFFSYETPVAAVVDGKVYVTTEKYSVTTSRHITQWTQGFTVHPAPPQFFDDLAANRTGGWHG